MSSRPVYFTDFFFGLAVPLITEGDVLKYTTMIVDLSSSPFTSVSFVLCLCFLKTSIFVVEIFYIGSFLFISIIEIELTCNKQRA